MTDINVDSAVAFGLGALATSLLYTSIDIAVIDAVQAFGVFLEVAVVFELVKQVFA